MLKKQIIIWAVCLILTALPLSFAEADDAPVPLYLGDEALLVGPDGREIVPPGEYAAIISLNAADDEPPLYAAGIEANGALRFCLMDAAGQALTEPIYDVLSRENGLICCQRDDLFGVLDADGTERIPPLYTALVPNGEGGLLALKTDCWDDQPDGVYVVDGNGVETAAGVKTVFLFDSVFSEGKMPLFSAENSRYGYVDPQGQWIIRPQFTYASDFTDGKASASSASGYGVIDGNGNWVLTPRYALVWRCEDTFIAVDGSEACIVFDAATLSQRFRVDGKDLYVYDDETNITVVDDESARLYALDGTLLYTAGPLATLFLTPGGRIVVEDGPWGSACAQLIGPDGAPVGEPCQSIFFLGGIDGAEYFGYMVMDAEPGAEEGDLWNYDPYSIHYGLMDENGVHITEALFDNIEIVNGSCFAVGAGESAGLIDVEGKWIARWDKAE